MSDSTNNISSVPVSVFWFRRDLRLDDNAGLYHALRSGNPVVPVFIFDTNILDDLDDKSDARVCFIMDTISSMQKALIRMGSTLHVLYGTPLDAFKELRNFYSVAAVFTNNDYEPYARNRDQEIKRYLKEKGIPFFGSKDQVIFDKDEVVKDNKEPYTVFTPYSKRWKLTLDESNTATFPTSAQMHALMRQAPVPLPSLDAIGFKPKEYSVHPAVLDERIARHYEKTRDTPGAEGTTRLSVHLRFGTVSIRSLVKDAMALNETLLNELIWREFYQMLLWHFPQTVIEEFKPAYHNIKWRNNELEFDAWRRGMTGYPLVDAGMRELNATGWMHNRVRMVVASFLCKHLLIDWRWGEAYFAQKLMDYDLASNVGNWQWAAGSGADAAPYFRIFNPALQAKKFDPKGRYIHKWVPELQELSYPAPIVEHDQARQRCLKTFKAALEKS